ncbi:MAG: HEAT repeat domain-containing protein [Deltaproteobacteria bacterium]|nr:MAG: HEAT repeat domain-containing protein [Deltaproteobacteria bacterium]
MRLTWLVCLLWTGLVLAGCKKKDPSQAPLQLYRGVSFTTASLTMLKKLKMSHKKWQDGLITHINNGKNIQWFSGKDTKKFPKNGYQLTVDMGMQPLPPDRVRKRVRLRWFIRYRMTPITSGHEHYLLQEDREYSYALRDRLPERKAVKKLYSKLWKDGLHSLDVFARLKTKTSKELTQALSSKDVHEQRHAVLLLGQRKYKPAVDKMIPLLKSQNRGVLLATIGALVRLRAKKAAVPLIKLSRQREGAFLAQILSALGEIGGEDAKGYLFTIASSHNNKLLQQSAQEALEELKQREEQAKKAAQQRQAPSPRRK